MSNSSVVDMIDFINDQIDVINDSANQAVQQLLEEQVRLLSAPNSHVFDVLIEQLQINPADFNWQSVDVSEDKSLVLIEALIDCSERDYPVVNNVANVADGVAHFMFAIRADDITKSHTQLSQIFNNGIEQHTSDQSQLSRELSFIPDNPLDFAEYRHLSSLTIH